MVKHNLDPLDVVLARMDRRFRWLLGLEIATLLVVITGFAVLTSRMVSLAVAIAAR